VLLLELKQKSRAPRNRRSTQIKNRGLVLGATAGVALSGGGTAWPAKSEAAAAALHTVMDSGLVYF